ncbi:flagellar basal body-associated FliL family protein [Caldifermentibacillus hisashii]|uniref:flagellar basal body-associated FliL family protein n=1 Tax=Caldifermentibacillus hisashii TaxID=996558 RepID=UPI002E079DC1|nr:flagellar basal body-associated FliL family protein [Caldifermentibacillus hisashii]MEC5271733.1 flagellar basal body-associated FliL family protein [Caldifermentibacillus hisashii]
MYKLLKLVGTFLLVIILTSCSNQTTNITIHNSNQGGNIEVSTLEIDGSDHSAGLNLTVETEEITTDLSDGNFVQIQFQLVTDTEQGKEELESRDFQIRNVLIKELTQLTANQLENFELVKSKIKGQINMMMIEGNVVDVLIVHKVVQ